MVDAASQRGHLARDHRFHLLRVREVVRETDEASTFVLDVPAELQEAFKYAAGQFCTFRVVIDGETHLRSYSMSSSAEVDEPMQVTVKRVAGGLVSNWLLDAVATGDVIEATCPAGVFTLSVAEGAGDVAAFSAGSGITPVLSILKMALATTGRHVHLLYANRDRKAVIFADELAHLSATYPGRCTVVHHLDVDQGFADASAVAAVLDRCVDPDVYVCGPAAFMDLVETVAAARSIDPRRVHVERFSPAEPMSVLEPVAVGGDAARRVTIELDGKVESTDHRAGTTILQTARQVGMTPPFSCEAGNCATCMARLVEGEASMFVNNALTDEEVASGWVLTCQAVPSSSVVRVIYGFDEE